MVMVKDSSDTLGGATLGGLGPMAELNLSSRRDKRDMSWFVETRCPIVLDQDPEQ